MRYFIIGFKNSGKTTFGRKLAQRLNLGFQDLDEYIEREELMSIPEIYNRLGEEGFRELEWKALKKIAGHHDQMVISTGGGAPCHCDNMTLMEKFGDVIYLTVSDETLIERLTHAAKDRPIVMGKTREELKLYIEDTRRRCEYHYRRAKYTVDGDKPDMDELIEKLRHDNPGKDSINPP